MSPKKPNIKSAKTKTAKKRTKNNKPNLKKYIILILANLFLRFVEHIYISENRFEPTLLL